MAESERDLDQILEEVANQVKAEELIGRLDLESQVKARIVNPGNCLMVHRNAACSDIVLDTDSMAITNRAKAEELKGRPEFLRLWMSKQLAGEKASLAIRTAKAKDVEAIAASVKQKQKEVDAKLNESIASRAELEERLEEIERGGPWLVLTPLSIGFIIAKRQQNVFSRTSIYRPHKGQRTAERLPTSDDEIKTADEEDMSHSRGRLIEQPGMRDVSLLLVSERQCFGVD
ncbi:hypothetical protein M8818_007279 [Zalaria obscura]|uniref:Uncharacterized protein n=1 Tax=Zalaria obscura TaxID=2024903 RepID=A0ACC3S522_9PEZI